MASVIYSKVGTRTRSLYPRSIGYAPWLVSQPQDSERRGGRESVPSRLHFGQAARCVPLAPDDALAL